MLVGVEVVRIRQRFFYGTAGTGRLDEKKGEVQVAETMRTRVPMQETGTEQFVVARSLL